MAVEVLSEIAQNPAVPGSVRVRARPFWSGAGAISDLSMHWAALLSFSARDLPRIPSAGRSG